MMNSEDTQVINLVADIGGTNIRLAITENNNITEILSYECAQFPRLIDVIRQYLAEKQLTNASINACLAIACPADDDLISMTNLPWQFSQKELKAELKLNKLMLINDYTAIAMAIPMLTDGQKVKIGGGEPIANKPIAVCGPGTGLGVANIIPVDNNWHCLSGEGGHIDFAPVDELDIQILQYLKTFKKRVSYEQLLSGYGLEQIYQALVVIKSEDSPAASETKLTAKDISAQAINGNCPLCQQALAQFCKVLGSFAGNLALTTASLGGVYIAGGIVPRFIDYVKNSGFRERFEMKGRMSHLNQQTPTYVITESQPGLIGAAAYLNQVCK
ncbi:glucokinase [Colwellia psychrerythraea]|uniref:Glucokinase n=1 Tax=Colwellia psychrerythraea TaxID=28229 RepID=A0A099L0B6_COLPS|nr:glucokinase [Colwellia psychrerythraea]KGJ96311.1 Glucokinase [Colwellia psychrerythraea]